MKLRIGVDVHERRGGHSLLGYPDDITRKVKVYAPSFDGKLDPNAFLGWLPDIEEYLDWYEMSDSHSVRFAKMKYIGFAKSYWQRVYMHLECLGVPPITMWAEMKQM